MKKVTVNVLIMALFVLFAGCNAPTTNTEMAQTIKEVIMKPCKDIDLPFQSFKIATDVAQTIVTNSGSEIKIPANVFVDENNNPVKEVAINFKEIRTAADIILSGITMAYDSAGHIYDFQTAGMFEIKGMTASGKPVFIKDGEQIEVNFSSNTEGNFNLYQLNQEGDKKGWNFIRNVATKTKEKIADKINTEDQTEHEDKAVLEKNTTLIQPIQFDPANDMVINGVPIDYKKFPELRPLKGAVWKYAGDDKTKEQVSVLMRSSFDSRKLEVIDKEKLLYQMVLSKKGVDKVVEISPTLSENMYQRAMKKYNDELQRRKDNQKIALAKLKTEMQRNGESISNKENECNLMRVAAISGFGVYNYDICFIKKDLILADANFYFDEEFGSAATNNIAVFLVSPSENRVVCYNNNTKNRFSFDPQVDNKLVAILPGNVVATFSSDEFNRLDIASIKNEKKCDFDLLLSGAIISSAADLQNILTDI